MTSEADLLVYYLPIPKQIYIVPMVDIRDALVEWEQRYRSRKLDNGWYFSHGLMVPLWELERIAIDP